MGTSKVKGRDACRLRRRRLLWKGEEYARRPWTAADEASLLLHVELLGYAWTVLAHSLRRSPDALRNKLLRLYGEWRVTEAARARQQLKALVSALQLKRPKKWGAEPPPLQLPHVRTYRSKPKGRTPASAAAG